MTPTTETKTTSRNFSGAALTQWRKRMGYSQREAAIALGCSRGAWAVWESGQKAPPRYIALACGALALGMKPYGEEG